MKLRAVVSVTVFFFLVAAAAPRPAQAQVWRESIKISLSKIKSYQFKDQALRDVLQVMAQDAEINIVLDEGAPGIDPARKITFEVTRMSIGDALTWVTRMSGLEWTTRDEAVYVTVYPRLSQQARLDIQARNIAWRAEAERDWLPRIRVALDKKINVTFVEKPLADCAASLRAMLGVNVIVSPGVAKSAPVTLQTTTSMTAENALAWISRQAGVDFAVLNNAVYFAPPAEIRIIRASGLDLSAHGRATDVVTFDFKDTPVKEAMEALGRQVGVSVVVKNDMASLPTVTLAGKDMSLNAALQAVANASGLNSAIIPEGATVTVTLMKPLPVAHRPAPEAVPEAMYTPAAQAAPSTDAALAAPAPVAPGPSTDSVTTPAPTGAQP